MDIYSLEVWLEVAQILLRVHTVQDQLAEIP